MNILLVLLLSLVFVLAFIIVPCYKSEIRNLPKNPRNNVHFYVARDTHNNRLYLYLGKPIKGIDRFHVCHNGCIVACVNSCTNLSDFRLKPKDFGLNPKDFENLKFEDEPIEVFVNM